jgi:hypothetical protein
LPSFLKWIEEIEENLENVEMKEGSGGGGGWVGWVHGIMTRVPERLLLYLTPELFIPLIVTIYINEESQVLFLVIHFLHFSLHFPSQFNKWTTKHSLRRSLNKHYNILPPKSP